MRTLIKTASPQVLADNAAAWLAEFQADKQNSTKKYRYRHEEIKTALLQETRWKCVYCESKIGHNTPGDIEHKVPSSKHPALHFEWSNLTTACTECNRRKNDYYVAGNEFLDPYADPVEELVEHHGPFVGYLAGNARAEITVRILQFSHASRLQLTLRKIERLEEFQNLISRYEGEEDVLLKELLRRQIAERQAKDSEYSAMHLSVARTKGYSNQE